MLEGDLDVLYILGELKAGVHTTYSQRRVGAVTDKSGVAIDAYERGFLVRVVRHDVSADGAVMPNASGEILATAWHENRLIAGRTAVAQAAKAAGIPLLRVTPESALKAKVAAQEGELAELKAQVAQLVAQSAAKSDSKPEPKAKAK